MEHSARRKLSSTRFVLSLFFLLASIAASQAIHAERAVSFNLSTSRTFSPDEKPSIHLYTHNVDELEFRVYHINDPEKFLSNLRDLHSFENGTPWAPKEQIDERTWLERFHDWKHHLWFLVRQFFRRQFSYETRDFLRAKQSSLAHRSRIVGVAQFAQIPLLNSQQLIARWRQEVPPTYISDSQDLPIDPLPSGFYLVEATDGHYKAYTVLMVSRVALVTRTGSGQVLAYVVDRHSGAPIPHAQVKLGFGPHEQASAETGPDGLAELHGPVSQQERDNIWVIATADKDVAAVTPAGYAFSGTQSNRWASFVYTDRPVYRPGHTVHWKAILRERIENHLELPKISSIHAVVSDQEDHSIFEKDLPISKDGTVTGDLTLANNAMLGYYSIRLGDGNDTAGGSFRVEEYKKPEYQVRVVPAKPRVLQGETNQVVIDSRYFFGEPVANAEVTYRIYHSPHYWWDEGEPDDTAGGPPAVGEDEQQPDLYDSEQESEQTGKLDANGKLTISVPTKFDSSGKQRSDQDYTIEAGVTDAANREITGRGRFLATYGSFRIHVEPTSYSVRAGEAANFRLTAIDYDNKPVQTQIHLQLVYRRWVNGKTETTQGSSTDVTTDAQGQATASLPAQNAGSAEVEASANTPEKRTVQDSTWLWVMGNGESPWYGSSQTVQIVADKKTYAPGDTAHLSIISQVDNFHALVVASGYSVEFKKVLSSEGKTLSFDLPITSDSQPNLDVSAVYIQNDQMYQASKQLKVPPVQEQLQIEIAPASQVFQPQQSATYDVYTRDYQGKPVSADLSFGVVDEALYYLYPDTSGDIVKRLYPDRYVYAPFDSSLQYYFSGSAGTKSPMLAERQSRYRPQLAQVKPGNDVVQPKVRKAFPDTAYWAANVHTDTQGHARVSFTFPDSLTTWRTTVRAVTPDSKAGAAINRVLVRKNIIVRMGAPRFMRKGDELTIPVIVHNYLDQAKQIQLSLDIHGLDTIAGTPQTITVPSKADGTVLWRVRASQIGTATLLAKALSTQESDALEISFPVEPSGVVQKLNQLGVVEDANGQVAASINFPANTDPAAHKLHIEVSPSIAGSIFSALDYLTSYPYGCTEQTMSSFLPDVIIAETLKKLNLPSRVDLNDLELKVRAGLDRLADFQHDDGGWGWWKEDDSRVFMTAYVISGVARAKQAYPLDDVKQQMFGKGVEYLQKAVAEHPRMLPELRAYVVYALTEADAGNTGDSLNTLWSRRNDLSAEGLALTGLAMLHTSDSRASQIAKLLEDKAKRSGALAYWPSDYNPLLDLYYDNNAESTAFAMRFLAHTDPKNPLLQQAAQWLVLNRNGGYWWNSTEQTAMVIFGLADYLATSQELNADFDVDVLVNGHSVAKRHFNANDATSGASLQVDIPATNLQPQGNSIQIVKHGTGRAYWSAQGIYYSTETKLYQKGNLSLNLTRDYFKLVPTQKKDQIVYQLQPLKGPVSPGDVLAVHIAANGSPVKYLMIEDPIPAGTEFIQNSDSYNIVGQPDTWQFWYTRQEFHDDRAAMFATEFDGRHESFYLLKVVNPGSFSISPARVELMYQPGIEATSDMLHLDVEAKQ
ncbi:MAG TPA: alpha-2-macroglobulin family protein [Pseudacidobacterium sp.]|nr:alpha-2-macroglobulin family protein [Pseudacidobacterium sp.]